MDLNFRGFFRFNIFSPRAEGDDSSPSEASIVANFVDSLLEQPIAGTAEVAFADTRGVWC